MRVVLTDRTGWHIVKDLAVRANLTPLFLPRYSPGAEHNRAGLALFARALPLVPSLARL
jgi:hypothetical protein